MKTFIYFPVSVYQLCREKMEMNLMTYVNSCTVMFNNKKIQSMFILKKKLDI